MATSHGLIPNGTEEGMRELQQFINDSAKAKRMFYLDYRWQDEKQYEDWKTYEAEMRKLIPAHWTFVKGNKSPFGMVVIVHGFKARITYGKSGRVSAAIIG